VHVSLISTGQGPGAPPSNPGAPSPPRLASALSRSSRAGGPCRCPCFLTPGASRGLTDRPEQLEAVISRRRRARPRADVWDGAAPSVWGPVCASTSSASCESISRRRSPGYERMYGQLARNAPNGATPAFRTRGAGRSRVLREGVQPPGGSQPGPVTTTVERQGQLRAPQFRENTRPWSAYNFGVGPSIRKTWQKNRSRRNQPFVLKPPPNRSCLSLSKHEPRGKSRLALAGFRSFDGPQDERLGDPHTWVRMVG